MNGQNLGSCSECMVFLCHSRPDRESSIGSLGHPPADGQRMTE